MSCCNDGMDQQGQMGQEMDLFKRSYAYEVVRATLAGRHIISVTPRVEGGDPNRPYPTNVRGNSVYLVGDFFLNCSGTSETPTLGHIVVTNIVGVEIPFRVTASELLGTGGLIRYYGAVSDIEILTGPCSWHFIGWEVLVAPEATGPPPPPPDVWMLSFTINNVAMEPDNDLTILPPTVPQVLTDTSATFLDGTEEPIGFSVLLQKLGSGVFANDWSYLATFDYDPPDVTTEGTFWKVTFEFAYNFFNSAAFINFEAQILGDIVVQFSKKALADPSPISFDGSNALASVTGCEVLAVNLIKITDASANIVVTLTLPVIVDPVGPDFADQWYFGYTGGVAEVGVVPVLDGSNWDVTLTFSSSLIGGQITAFEYSVT